MGTKHLEGFFEIEGDRLCHYQICINTIHFHLVFREVPRFTKSNMQMIDDGTASAHYFNEYESIYDFTVEHIFK